MTQISIQTLISGAAAPIVTKGSITFLPWMGRSSRVVVEGSNVIFPEPFTITIDKDTPSVIEVRATNEFWCWLVEVKTEDSKPYRVYVTIPESTAVIEFEDLPVVDPRTFAPIVVPPSTQELLAEANEVLESVTQRTLTATVDPANPEVLILTFPSFMLSPTDDKILVLPIGG